MITSGLSLNETVDCMTGFFGINARILNELVLIDEPVGSRDWVKKMCFADEIEFATKFQRRKQRVKVEFLLEDYQLSDEDANDGSRAFIDDAVSANMTNAKANDTSFSKIVEPLSDENRPAEPTQPQKIKQNSITQKRKGPAKSNEKIIAHHLVREFLHMHCHDDILSILDQERSMPALSAKESKHLSWLLTGANQPTEPALGFPSLLERLIVHSNDSQLKVTLKRSTKIPAAKGTPIPTSSRKVALNVITHDLDCNANKSTVNTPVNNQYFNRLNLPEFTLHDYGTIIGEPGSTPMAHFKDLHRFGFEDVDDSVSSMGVVVAVNGSVDKLSHYARRKRNLNMGHKRVQFGESGKPSTQEYIFFRETPPSFVTESLEDATEIFGKLSGNVEFVNQAQAVERFIELQSSDVSKYTVGQVIEKLGPQYNINGVIFKIFGSRLCGTAGRGSIIVDTCTENLQEHTCVRAQCSTSYTHVRII